MTIILNLNSEQETVLAAVVSEHNENSGDKLSADQYLTRSLNAQIESYVNAAFDASVKRLAAAAVSLPYEQRLAVIATIESQLNQQ